MTEDHATVRIGEYTVPLIGVPPDASKDKCQVCGLEFYIGDMVLDGAGRTLCQKCHNSQ
jgi:hypothetical protein